MTDEKDSAIIGCGTFDEDDDFEYGWYLGFDYADVEFFMKTDVDDYDVE